MEKFLLCLVLAADELDIVHQQNISLAVFIVERNGRFRFNGFNQLVGKILALDINGVFPSPEPP